MDKRDKQIYKLEDTGQTETETELLKTFLCTYWCFLVAVLSRCGAKTFYINYIT